MIEMVIGTLGLALCVAMVIFAICTAWVLCSDDPASATGIMKEGQRW